MDNVILKPSFDFPDDYGRNVVGPKRIKLSNLSHQHVLEKIVPFTSVETKDHKEIPSSQDVTPVEKKVEVAPVHSSSVLDNVNLEDFNQFADQTVISFNSKLIRLTDGMYDRVAKNTSNPDTTVALEDITANDSSLHTESESSEVKNSAVEVSSTDIKEAIDGAFEQSKEVVNEGNQTVKKAPYPRFKAKIHKYNSMPTNMLSDGGLFGSKPAEVSVTVSEKKDDSTNDREVPLVAPERIYKFLFNDLENVSESSKKVKKVEKTEFSFDEVNAIADKDDELANLLAQVEERKQAEADSKNKMDKAKKVYESSVEVLTKATERYDKSNEALSVAKEQAYAYLHQIETNIEDNVQREKDLRDRAKQQMEKAHMMDQAADKNEAHVEQFNTVLALNSNEAYHEAKTYSRNVA